MKPLNDAFPYISPVWTRLTPIVAERGQGCILYDVDGKAYLSCARSCRPSWTGFSSATRGPRRWRGR